MFTLFALLSLALSVVAMPAPSEWHEVNVSAHPSPSHLCISTLWSSFVVWYTYGVRPYLVDQPMR